ncbi:MAG: ABC transporter ATP-binding protein [Promethearchaeia archaeon]
MSIFEKRIKSKKMENQKTPMQEKKMTGKNPETVMVLKNLTKKYGKHIAVDNIIIEVHEGETIGLIGPNGAGKTTTIKMIAKLLRPNAGKILIKNTNGELQDLHQSSKDLVRRGFLIDVPFFYEEMTTYQHLRYFATSQDYPDDKIDDRINELLLLFKLNDWKHEKVKSFSKGMRQKLGIIQALLVDPQILILDEPQTGLDPNARIEIRKIIRKLKNQGKTIFVASHMLHEISEVCDKIALLNHGKIIGFDTIENLNRDLKTKQIKCKLYEALPSEKIEPLIEQLFKELDPYLDKNLDPNIAKSPIKYAPDKKTFTFFYNNGELSKVDILRILIKKFESDLKVKSFTEPKTSQLERIYAEMIQNDEPRIKLQSEVEN